MAQVIDQLINGHRFDWSSIRLTVLTPVPVICTLIGEVNYEYSRDFAVLRGTSAKKLGRTRGQFDSNGSVSFYIEEFTKFRRALGLAPLPAGGGFMEKTFQITVAYREALPAVPTVDTLIGCTLVRVARQYSVGPDALMVACDIDIMDVLDGGDTPMRDFGAAI